MADTRIAESILSGEFWIERVQEGEHLRLTDLHGNQAIDTIFYNANNPYERYSAFDTIQLQRNIYLTKGSILYSDRQRPMLEIVDDTCGRHDTLGGACSSESNTVRYALEKKTMHSCRDSWLLALNTELGEYGLNKKDLPPNVNFFMNVPVTKQGGLTFEDGISAPGKYVELRARMDILVLISNCQKLNNTCNGYDPTPVEARIIKEAYS